MANRVQQFIRSVLFNSSLNAIRMKDMKNKNNLLKTKNRPRLNHTMIQKHRFHSFERPPMLGFGGGEGGGGGDPNDIIKIIVTMFAIYVSRKFID
jgi:hypothetical protein